MKTLKRKCVKNYELTSDGLTAKVERDKKYITTEERDGMVTVFSNYWFTVPEYVFSDEDVEVFTEK